MSDERMRLAFDSAASEYEQGRPGYPADAIDLLAAELRLDERSTVVDLAAGTGKLTRDLVGCFGRVIAVEPLDAMRAELERQVPGAEALDGRAEAIPLPDASANAFLVAQAFHWFEGSAAVEEIARVLRPGGGLGLLWNTTPWELREGPWFSALDDVLERSRADLSTLRRHGSGQWAKVFEGRAPFGPLRGRTLANPREATVDEFLAGFASRSYVASMDASDRDELLAEVRALLGRADAPIEGGRVAIPMRTDVYWTRLL
jgi:SAM-dependent methyltransferase